MDGEVHRHRKHMFMSFMTPASIQYLVARALDEMRLHATTWKGAGRVVLYDEFLDILARAACQWAGVPIEEPGFALTRCRSRLRYSTLQATRCRALASASGAQAFGALGGGARSQHASGRLKVPEDRALHIIALHRDQGGSRCANMWPRWSC